MFNQKIVYFDASHRFKTLSNLFAKHRRGHLTIVLQNDIYDEKDIYVPKTLKSLNIISDGDVQRRVVFSNITLYCEGVNTHIEHVGTYGMSMNLVVTQADKKKVSISITSCVFENVIGALGVSSIKEMIVSIHDSSIKKLQGINSDTRVLNCSSLDIMVCNSNIDVIEGIERTNGEELKGRLDLCNGKIKLNDCKIKEIKFWVKDKDAWKNNGYLVLCILGDSTVSNGIA